MAPGRKSQWPVSCGRWSGARQMRETEHLLWPQTSEDEGVRHVGQAP